MRCGHLMALLLVSFMPLRAFSTAPLAPTMSDSSPVPVESENWPSRFNAPSEADVLKTLRGDHPRLIVTATELMRIQSSLSDPVAKAYYDTVKRLGDTILTQPVSERVLVGPRLLETSRHVLDRLYTLGLLYRLNGDPRYLDRAKREMLAVAAFSDWNPSHFLDVAEMSHAMAIGYDWFYSDLSATDRATIKAAIKSKGLAEGKKAYDSKAWWFSSRYNWNTVCNSGLIVAALALADEEPALASNILARGIAAMPLALSSYGPDGAWPEGPGYWAYGTQYNINAVAALQTALGTDFGLTSSAAFARTGDFRLYAADPMGFHFNFGDAGLMSRGDEDALFWLARRYAVPAYAYAARTIADGYGSVRDLIWFDARGRAADLVAKPTDAYFRGGPEVVSLRSAWDDSNALWVGFKGGNNSDNHVDLDLGTFALAAQGVRWAIELGSDYYDLPGYWDAVQRWAYYRKGTIGQNIFLVNGSNQDLKAIALIIGFQAGSSKSWAIADLSQAYAAQGVTSAMRGVALIDNKSRALIQDEIKARKPVNLLWGMHTQAAVILNGAKAATLTQNGKTLKVLLLSPIAGAHLEVNSVSFTAPQYPLANLSKLSVVLDAEHTSSRITLLLVPEGASSALPNVKPLAEWAKTGP